MIPKISTPKQITAINYMLMSDFVSFTENSNGTISVVFPYGYLFKQIYATQSTIDYLEEAPDTDAGVRYDTTLKFSHPNDNSTNAALVQTYRRTRFVCAIMYSDGTQKMFGYKEPATMRVDMLSKYPFLTNRNFIILCQSTQEAKYFTYSFEIEGEGIA